MHVEVTEVVLRDGLQDEPVVVSTKDKLRVLKGLTDAGIRSIEVTSFVNPKKLPQLADAERLCSVLPRIPGVKYSALTLNPRGVERASRAGVDVVNVVVSASTAHSAANSGRSTEQALADACESVAAHPELVFTGSVSTAFTFPGDGVISAARVVDVVGSLHGSGIRSIGLADTIGDAEPERVAETVAAVIAAFPDLELALHLHDGLGQALATVDLALSAGIRRFDSALGGYGGCPYAPGAHGNIATEGLVRHLQQLGHETGVDLEALATARETLEDSLMHGVPVH